MAGTIRLTRRGLVAAGGALVAGRAGAAPEDIRRITLGTTTFSVPKPYVFGEMLLPGTTMEGVPPNFSFAFLAPSGAPAAAGLQFPPVTRPFELERENGQFLVMCYRTSSAAPGAPGNAPHEQLANNLTSTERHQYSSEEGALVVRSPGNPDEHRYLSLTDRRNDSGIEAFLFHIAGAQFFYGLAQFAKCELRTTMFIPEERHSEIGNVIARASELLFSWKEQ